MGKKLIIAMLCVVMLLGVTACGNSKKAEEEAAKAKQEEIQKENQAQANAFISAVEALPETEELKVKDAPAVEGARALFDALTDEQKELVPEEIVTRLEDAEKKIDERKTHQEEMREKRKANKKAAKEATDAINKIPDNLTLDAEDTVYAARNAYSKLNKAQKKFVSKKTLAKLTNAEAKIEQLKVEETKKAEEEKKAQEEAKKKKEEAAKKAKEQSKKKKEKTEDKKADDKYSIAKKYVGKKATALIKAIGSPKKKKKDPNCATDGEEYIYYYDGFYVGVLSQTMKSPLIVQNVTKN